METQNQLTQYDELAVKHDAAYLAFEKIYKRKTPPPQMPKIAADDRLVHAALIGLVIASIIVSASHTIPTFVSTVEAGDDAGGNILITVVSIAAFAMIELGILSFAYILIKKMYEKAEAEGKDAPMPDISGLLKAGLGLTIIVALLGNLHSTMKADFGDSEHWEKFAFVVGLLIGISAPALAFISGECFGVLTVDQIRKAKKATAEYEERLAVWQDSLNASWNSQKARWGIRIEVSAPDRQQTDNHLPSGLSVSEQTDSRQTRQSSYGFNRTPDGQAKVIEYLIANPEAAALPSRKLAELVGVGHDTANKGRNAWRDQQTKTE